MHACALLHKLFRDIANAIVQHNHTIHGHTKRLQNEITKTTAASVAIRIEHKRRKHLYRFALAICSGRSDHPPSSTDTSMNWL